jgi:carboxymethylenebutenolidase
MSVNSEVGGVPGYRAVPSGKGPWPALIVVQEWWGLDAQTESIASRFAREGYLTFSPDIYRGELAALGDNQAAMTFVQKHAGHAVSDMVAVFDALKADPDSTGKVGSVGFCFGGRMSLALGLERPVDAVCTFYGGQMQNLFGRMDAFHSPVLGFFGDQDVSIPVGTIDEFRAILKRIGVENEVIVYPDSGHAFFRDSDSSVYRPKAAQDAWPRAKTFFKRHLS